MVEKRPWGSVLAHQKTKNKCPISASSSAPCTTLLEGPAVQVWACPDAPDRFYGSATRQVPTPIRPKSSTRKTACLDPTSGPLQGTGKHVVRSDLAQPVAYTLGTSQFTYAHMEPFSTQTMHFGLHNVQARFTSFVRWSACRASQDQYRPWQWPVTHEWRGKARQWMESIRLNPWRGYEQT